MANYIAQVAGRLKEIAGLVTSAGAGDAGKLVQTDSNGRLDNSLMPVGIGAETKTYPASEALSAGNWVNIWDDGGTLKVRKADATTTGKEADGFVLANVSSDATATVYFEGTNNQLSSLTGGTLYYLSTTAGLGTTTAPSATGNIVQPLGKSLSTTEISFERGEPIEKA